MEQTERENDENDSNAAAKFVADCFCAGVPIRQALDAAQQRYGMKGWDTIQSQNEILSRTILYENELRNVIPEFSFGFSRSNRFTRLLLDEIDHCGVCISEELAMVAALLCEGHGKRDEMRWILIPLSFSVSIKLCVGDAFSSVGLQVWEAGIWLSYIMSMMNISNPIVTDVKGKNILELASGTGICAYSFINIACAKHLIVSDIGHQVVQNLYRNIEANQLSKQDIDVMDLDVTHTTKVRAVVDAHQIDTIFAADVTFEESLSKSMIKAMAGAIKGTNRIAWLVATQRNEKLFHMLPKLFEDCALHAQEIDSEYRPQKPAYFVQDSWDRITAWRLVDKNGDQNHS